MFETLLQVFHHCITMINLYVVFKRKGKYFIIILRSSVHMKSFLYRTVACVAKIAFTTTVFTKPYGNYNIPYFL